VPFIVVVVVVVVSRTVQLISTELPHRYIPFIIKDIIELFDVRL
jgi:hypothetical protein